MPFPESFVLGTATAAYQIEGAVHEGGRGPSIWDTFSHTPGRVAGGDTGDIACDHYHRLEDDLDLMASLGLEAYRFSIAWPRIVPEGRGRVNQEGLDFYGRLLDGLIARGIQPLVTLYHWDLPQPLEDEGGWTVRGTAEAFADYARVVAREYGDRVHTWTTLNEPWCAAFLGYAAGVHAPGVQSEEASLRAAHHLNLAHGLAAKAIRAELPQARVSITHNLHVFRPEGPTGAEAVRLLDAVGNRIWLGPELDGVYPADLRADTAHITDWSFVQAGDLETIRQPLDVLGINYYTTALVRMRQGDAASGTDPHGSDGVTPFPGSQGVEWLQQPGPVSEMGWHIEPEGLRDLLLRIHRTYPGLPTVVTENGMAAKDAVVVDGVVQDDDRIDYVRRHLAAVEEAIAAGAPVEGYFVWSLLDNFEWAFGYEKRFGIVHVDLETQQRTPKKSARWYADLIASRRPS